jgi:hypothetical protein
MGHAWSGVVVAAVIGLGPLIPGPARADTVAATSHVRATTEEIRRILQAGLSTSPTFRRLVAALDDSDVIVYVEPKLARKGLGGYLSHAIVAAGSYRYLRVAVETAGPPHARVPLLAHELQHAVEVSRAQAVRDAESVERLFRTLAIPHGCSDSGCYETQEGTDAERLVRTEMSPRGRASLLMLAQR